MKVLVPASFPLKLDVECDVVEYDFRAPIPEEHSDADVLVEWGSRAKEIDGWAGQLTQVRLVQSLKAGADEMVRAGFRDGAIICNGVGLHDATVAEHALALTLALVRKLPQVLEAQSESRWAHEIGGRQPLYTKPVMTLLDANVVIWGFGSIAKTLAPMLTALGARVTGVARSAGEREGYPVVAEDDLADALAEADVLIMILPHTEATEKALDAERLARLPEHAYVVNVGRGATVDEDALLAALQEGVIAGAAIDVTAVEPLPEESPLWSAPNLIITPHAAGGRPVRADAFVSEQIRRLQAGEELRNVVN